MQSAWALFSSAACPAVQYLSTLSHKRRDLKRVIEGKMYVLIFSTNLSDTSLIVRRNEQDMIKNV